MSAFDPDKDAANKAKHGILLAEWVKLDAVATVMDHRFHYGEIRFRSYGWIEGVSYCLVFTVRDGQLRPISLRRARNKEMKRYVP